MIIIKNVICVKDKDQLDKLIKSSSFENATNFKSGMILGMNVLTMHMSAHSKIMIICINNNYLGLITLLYKLGDFKIAPSLQLFDDSKHDCVIYNECLCIRGKALDRILSKEIEGYSRNTVIKHLVDINALKFKKDKYTIKIHSCFNRRFYANKLKMINLEV